MLRDPQPTLPESQPILPDCCDVAMHWLEEFLETTKSLHSRWGWIPYSSQPGADPTKEAKVLILNIGLPLSGLLNDEGNAQGWQHGYSTSLDIEPTAVPTLAHGDCSWFSPAFRLSSCSPTPLYTLPALVLLVQALPDNDDDNQFKKYYRYSVDEKRMGGRKAVERALEEALGEGWRIEWDGWGELVVRRDGGAMHERVGQAFIDFMASELATRGLRREIKSFGSPTCQNKSSGAKRYPDASYGTSENLRSQAPHPSFVVEVADSQEDKEVRKKMVTYLEHWNNRVRFVVLILLNTRRSTNSFTLKLESWCRINNTATLYPYPDSSFEFDSKNGLPDPPPRFLFPLNAFRGEAFPTDTSVEQGEVVEWESEWFEELLLDLQEMMASKAEVKRKARDEKGKGKGGLKMVNVPKTRRTYCKGKQCRKHTPHKVTQYKTGKASVFAQGKRRYDRKQSGYGGQTKPVFHKKAKTTKKVVLRLECTVCKYKMQMALKRCKHFELGGDTKVKGAALVF
ncbi:hypothetical protein MNV49_005029 [Pseudohyphozyma bogoriensis]|nr:hypothetical protein MNV49_005029 [Pseudohyphozyma bogoriensis]